MAYFALRGRVIGGMMLGRTGRAFSRREIELVEQVLGPITIGRATFGLPGLVSAHLPPAPKLRSWPWGERILARRTSPVGEIRVRDRNGYREMVARNPASGAEMIWSRASIADPSLSGWPYVDLFHCAAHSALRRERALFLGCGGAVGPRQFAAAYPGIHLDVVESDPAVIDLARAFFALDEIPHLNIHLADGVPFLERAEPCSWDVVIVDAYGAEELAGGFAARRVFGSLRAALRPGGAMGFNVVGALDGSKPVRTILRAAALELEDVRVVPVMNAHEAYESSAVRNVVVVGVKARSP